MTERVPLEETLQQYAAQGEIRRLWTVAGVTIWVFFILWVFGFGSPRTLLSPFRGPLLSLVSIVGLDPPSGGHATLAAFWLLIGVCTGFSLLESALLLVRILSLPLTPLNKVIGWIRGRRPRTMPSADTLLPWSMPARIGLRRSPKRRVRGQSVVFQLAVIWWLLFGDSASPIAFAPALFFGTWLMLVSGIRVFERVTAKVDSSVKLITRLTMFGFVLIQLRLAPHAFDYDDAKFVKTNLEAVQKLSKWSRRRLVWVRLQLDSDRIDRWATFLTLLDATLWFSGLLFGSIMFWAGFLGIVSSGCSGNLTDWIQIAASAFLPAHAPDLPCAVGWRLACAASFWLILSVLVAPAAARMDERRKALHSSLGEVRSTVRMFVKFLLSSDRRN
jgi:hypothetical protein